MENNEMPMELVISQFREMFPDLDEGIILCAYIENDNNFEKTLNELLTYQTKHITSNKNSKKVVKEIPKEKEISIFNNLKDNNFYKNNIVNQNKTQTNVTQQIKNSNSNTQEKPKKIDNLVGHVVSPNSEHIFDDNKDKSIGQKFKSKFKLIL